MMNDEEVKSHVDRINWIGTLLAKVNELPRHADANSDEYWQTHKKWMILIKDLKPNHDKDMFLASASILNSNGFSLYLVSALYRKLNNLLVFTESSRVKRIHENAAHVPARFLTDEIIWLLSLSLTTHNDADRLNSAGIDKPGLKRAVASRKNNFSDNASRLVIQTALTLISHIFPKDSSEQNVMARARIEASAGSQSETKKHGRPLEPLMTNEAKCLGLLANNPGWTDTKIAKVAGISRTSLYRWPTFKMAREAQEAHKKSLPQGSKDRNGNIETWKPRDKRNDR